MVLLSRFHFNHTISLKHISFIKHRKQKHYNMTIDQFDSSIVYVKQFLRKDIAFLTFFIVFIQYLLKGHNVTFCVFVQIIIYIIVNIQSYLKHKHECCTQKNTPCNWKEIINTGKIPHRKIRKSKYQKVFEKHECLK